jgi:hypothetical protein
MKRFLPRLTAFCNPGDRALGGGFYGLDPSIGTI